MKSSTKSKIGLVCIIVAGVIILNGLVYIRPCTTEAFIIMNSALLLIGLYAFGAWLFINNNTD